MCHQSPPSMGDSSQSWAHRAHCTACGQLSSWGASLQVAPGCLPNLFLACGLAYWRGALFTVYWGGEEPSESGQF